MVIPFGLKNTPAIFSRIAVSAFKDFIHNFLEVYFDDWTVFGLVRDHIENLRMMLERCRQYQIALNLRKFIFFAPSGVLLGHVVCQDWILVDPMKVAIILDLPPPTLITQIRYTLGHTGYYQKFIKGYVEITTPMEKLLKKDAKFEWNEEFQESLDKLKNKMATTPILIFPDWKKELHVHVDASSIVLGIVLTKQREGAIDHLIAFASKKISTKENNYTKT